MSEHASSTRYARPTQASSESAWSPPHEFLRDRGACLSWGTGAAASVTMRLGEQANPVSISIYRDGAGSNFDVVRDKRTPDEMQCLADLMRRISGVASYIQGLEDQNWGSIAA